jgi:hypothetical protein
LRRGAAMGTRGACAPRIESRCINRIHRIAPIHCPETGMSVTSSVG